MSESVKRTFADQLDEQKKLSQSAKFSQSKKVRQSLDVTFISKKLAASQKLLNVKGLIVDDSSDSSDSEDEIEIEDADADFDSVYSPADMRCLALIAHNHMKPAMKDFVLTHKNLLKKFRLTGTNTTMSMLREVFGDDPTVLYGPTCQSGPLGGDAEVAALMCIDDLGGMVFFQDPMSAHPHTADIDCLNRQALVHNVLCMNNPASAHAGLATLRLALKEGKSDLIPSFFFTLESPSVSEYKVRQNAVLKKNIES